MLPLQACANQTSPLNNNSSKFVLLYAFKSGFCIISRSFASSQSEDDPVLIECPRSFKAALNVSRMSSSMEIFSLYFGFHRIAHESTVSVTFVLLYPIPLV